jgi:hypothetical protein
MSKYARKLLHSLAPAGLIIVLSVAVSACGGSTQSAGIGGTGIVARGYVQGEITGFGSIFVNGIEFDTDNSEFIVDGEVKANQMLANLNVGMVVRLEVETENGNYTGNTFKVVYDDEVQGPVAATPQVVPGSGGTKKTFTIFGQTVTIDEIQTVFNDTSFATLQAGDVVEISGFRISPTEISASYVEWKESLADGSAVELRGIVAGYSPPLKAFTLNGFPVNFDDSTVIEVDGGLVDGVYVEVKGSYRVGPPPFVLATKIEQEDEGFGANLDNLSLQGIISNYVSLANFQINGQQVDASQASLSPANAEDLLGDGVEVEVDGDIVGGVLMAEELELRVGETELRTRVSDVEPANNLFRVAFPSLSGTVVVRTNAQTLFEDDSSTPLVTPPFSLDDLAATDFVRVEGREVNGEVVANIVKRTDAAGRDVKLEGVVDSFDANTSITILGIAYQVAPLGETTFEDYPDPADFFTALREGDFVEIKDEFPANGVADNVKLDD